MGLFLPSLHHPRPHLQSWNPEVGALHIDSFVLIREWPGELRDLPGEKDRQEERCAPASPAGWGGKGAGAGAPSTPPSCALPPAPRWRRRDGGDRPGLTEHRNPSAQDWSYFGSSDSNVIINFAPPTPYSFFMSWYKMKISYNNRWAVTDKGLRVCNGLYTLTATAMTFVVPPKINPQFPSFLFSHRH